MKRILWIPMLTLILALVSGCGDSPAAPTGDGGGGGIFGGGGNGTVSASIDGEDWTSTFTTAVRVAGGVVIAGLDDNDLSIEIGFLETDSGLVLTGEGTNAFCTVREGGMFWSTGMLGDGAGTIEITSFSAEGASGTFSFTTAENPLSTPLERVITEGTFNVSF